MTAPDAPARRPATPTSDPAERAGGVLDIDLDAAAWNYRRLCRALGPSACAAVVKADAYGLGAARLAPAFARAGARCFFVASLDEGVALRPILDDAGVAGATIYVLNGPLPGTEADFRAFGLRPVLNSLGDLDLWRRASDQAGTALPAALHVDTGMSRLGLPESELAVLAHDPARLEGIALSLVMSHLACADTPDHPENKAQQHRFDAARAALPAIPASLANSSGIFLGPGYHFALARPGVALYGVNPTPGRDNPMRRVVRLRGRVLQVRQIDAPRGVGYGAAFRAGRRMRIATVAAGYADGLLRSVSNRGQVIYRGRCLPIVGRVSMDSITVDVTDLPEDAPMPGDFVEILGDAHDVDALAAEAGTVGYEMLTALGGRYHRRYHDGGMA